MTYSDPVDNFTYFSEELCSRADDALRQAFLLCMDRKVAHSITDGIFKKLADDLVNTRNENNISKLIVRESWAWVKDMGNVEMKHDNNEIVELFKGVSLEGRAALGAVDFLGLTAEDAGQALGMSDDDLRMYLVEGRKALLNKKL